MFDKRKQEIHARLEETIKNMPARETTSLKDQQVIRDAVNRYFVLRQRTLDEAIGFLGSTTKTPEEQRARWTSHFQTKAVEGSQILKDSLKDKRETLFTKVISDMVTEESDFYINLTDLQLADTMQARMIMYKQQFETEKNNLMDKWEDLLNTNKNVNASIADISEKLKEVYDNGLDILEKTNTSIRENLAKGLWLWATMDESTPSPPSIFTPISVMVDTLNNFMVNGSDIAYKFDQLYRSEESVTVIMFGNTRRSVKEFLEDTNLDKALKEYTEAENKSLEAAKGMLTKGQQEDAQLFVTTAANNTKAGLRAFTDQYNDFIDEFKEIFIGPVGDRTVDDLIQKKQWDENKNEWLQINIQDKLKKIYDDSREWVDLDIYKFSEADKAVVEKALAEDRERLDKALTSAGNPTMIDALKTFMSLAKDNMFSKVKST